MKIVHLCLCAPFYEGYAYQDNLLPKYQKKAGCDVTVITSPYGKFTGKNSFEYVGPGISYLKDGIKLVRLQALLPQRINMHIYAYCGLLKVLKQETPDLLFVHGVESINYVRLSKFKKIYPNVIIVFDNHTDEINSLHHWATRFYSKLIVKGIVIPRLIPIAKWFYGTTPKRNEFLINYYAIPKEKVKLLLMGADDDEMNIEKKETIRKELRTKYGIVDDDFLLVTGGKIDPKKNIHILAKAVACSSHKKIKIIIFGSIHDELKETFKQIESERVQLVGWQPSNEVYKFFYAADIVFFPGLHSVMWEQAVASKVPCAFNHIKGFEHIDIGGNCILMDGKDVNYYQSLIENLFIDKEKYLQMVDAANSPRSEDFLYSRISQSVINDYKDIKTDGNPLF